MRAPMISTPASGSTGFRNDSQNGMIREVDYSEYEWMEHIDEFDREVIRLLEEEAFYEQCFLETNDDFDADDLDDEDYSDDDDGSYDFDGGDYFHMGYADHLLPNPTTTTHDIYFLAQTMATLGMELSQPLDIPLPQVFSSSLNPEAPEFYPRSLPQPEKEEKD